MPHPPLFRTLPAVLFTAAWPALTTAQDSFAGCRALTDPAARLACYDRLPLPAAPSAPPAGSAPARPAAASPAPALPAAQDPAKFGLPATATAPAPAAPPPAAQDPAQFGLPATTIAQLEAIQSQIPGHFEGWQAGSRIRLANGQVWQVTDGTSRFANLENPRVTVRRGSLGSFFLEIDGVTPSPRVRRIE